MPQVRRSIKRQLSFSEAEFAHLTNGARLATKPFARYVREAALGRRLVVPAARFDRALLRDLARIGNNINQLAREANAARAFPAEAKLAAVYEEHTALMRQLAAVLRGEGGGSSDTPPAAGG